MRMAGDRLRHALFLIAVLLILGGTLFANQTLGALTDIGERRDRARATVNAVDRLMLDLRRSELAARNYARSGETGHHEAYDIASRAAHADLAALRALVADDPAQQRRLDDVEPLVAESLAIIASFVRPSSPGFLNSSLFNAQIRRRDFLARTIDGGIGEITQAEDQLYLSRRQAAPDKAGLTRIALLGTAGVSALTLCAVLYLMMKEIRRRRAAEVELATLNLQLEDRVTAQTADLSLALQTLRQETAIRREAEQHLRKLQRELVRASRLTAIGQIGAMLAHEINQPLTAMLNYLRSARHILTAGHPEAMARLPDVLEKTEQQVIRAAAVVQRLRDYVGRRETHQALESLPDMIEDACALAMAGASPPAVELSTDLDPAARIVLVDRTQILQVLVNLMRNALEAMAGSERRELAVSTALRADGMVEVAIADSGPGLPDEVRRQLFTPFVTTKPDGLGIGLSSCEAIIEAHGGRINAKPRSGGGTVFRFTLHGQSPRTPLSDPTDAETPGKSA